MPQPSPARRRAWLRRRAGAGRASTPRLDRDPRQGCARLRHVDLVALRDMLPFAKLVGIELLEASAEVVRGRLEWSPGLCTAGGLMHGGALMSLAHTCGALCAFLALPQGAPRTP